METTVQQPQNGQKVQDYSVHADGDGIDAG